MLLDQSSAKGGDQLLNAAARQLAQNLTQPTQKKIQDDILKQLLVETAANPPTAPALPSPRGSGGSSRNQAWTGSGGGGNSSGTFWVTQTSSGSTTVTPATTVTTHSNSQFLAITASTLSGALVGDLYQSDSGKYDPIDNLAVRNFLRKSLEFDYECPDKTVLKFRSGNVEIVDKDAKVVYKSNPVREFNKYLNASDLLEEFVQYCGREKISQSEFRDLPLSLFIMWLIVRVAETDREDPGEALPLLTSGIRERKAHTHRCGCCGRFLSREFQQHSLAYCTPEHMMIYMTRKQLTCR